MKGKRRTLSVSVVLVALTALGPLLTTVPSSASSGSCEASATIAFLDVTIHTPSVLGSGKGTFNPFQLIKVVSLDPACETLATECSIYYHFCYVSGWAKATSSSGGAGVSMQLQRENPQKVGKYQIPLLKAWTNLDAPVSCRAGLKGSKYQYCRTPYAFALVGAGEKVRAVCTWKAKPPVVDKNPRIEECVVNVSAS